LTDLILQVIKTKKPPQPDGSGFLTGLILGLILPPSLPWWTAAVGSFVALAIGKHVFGGLGFNIFNPALIGRAFLQASWPILMTTWQAPFQAITTATPLALVKSQFNLIESLRLKVADYPSLFFLGNDPKMLLSNIPLHLDAYWQLFIGNRAGCIGETSALALLLGVLFLFYKKVIDWRIPLAYVIAVAIFSMLFNQDPIFHILAGGLIIGAFFMATDPVTSPLTKKGRWIFGAGCGVLTVIIRLLGGYPEGVCYAILLMNSVTPLLDRYTLPRRFGK
jgi:electron transport complex protein RnfD